MCCRQHSESIHSDILQRGGTSGDRRDGHRLVVAESHRSTGTGNASGGVSEAQPLLPVIGTADVDADFAEPESESLFVWSADLSDRAISVFLSMLDVWYLKCASAIMEIWTCSVKDPVTGFQVLEAKPW